MMVCFTPFWRVLNLREGPTQAVDPLFYERKPAKNSTLCMHLRGRLQLCYARHTGSLACAVRLGRGERRERVTRLEERGTTEQHAR